MFISFASISAETHEQALSKLRHGGSEECHTEARSHVLRSITSSDTRRGSSSRSMRIHSKKVTFIPLPFHCLSPAVAEIPGIVPRLPGGWTGAAGAHKLATRQRAD